jgi:hypothetical protein
MRLKLTHHSLTQRSLFQFLRGLFMATSYIFFYQKDKILLNFIIVHKNLSFGFRIHGLSHGGYCPLTTSYLNFEISI